MNIHEVLTTLVTADPKGATHPKFDQISGALKDIAGRWAVKPEITVSDSEDELDRADIRIDPDAPFVSGDVFGRNPEFAENYKLGGKTNWRYSFYGPLRYVIRNENELIYFGVTAVVRNGGSSDDPFVQRGAIAIATDLGGKTLKRFEFLYFFRGFGTVRTWHAESVGARAPVFFRKIKLLFWRGEALPGQKLCVISKM